MRESGVYYRGGIMGSLGQVNRGEGRETGREIQRAQRRGQNNKGKENRQENKIKAQM